MLSAARCPNHIEAASQRAPRHARQALAALGGDTAESAADALGCRRVVLCLPDDGIVASVLEESGEALPSGATVIDTTPGAQLRQAKTGARLAARISSSSRCARTAPSSRCRYRAPSSPPGCA